MEFFATCPTGFEQLLASELRELGMQAVRPLRGQVAFTGTDAQAMRACLWSRLASRIVLVLDRVDAANADVLYESLARIPWEEHVLPAKTFAVDASGTNAELRTTQFVALRSKDAIVDHMFHTTGVRPSVDAKRPDLRIAVRVSRTRATVGIDMTGEPLFRRGYERDRRGLRPDYAAAFLAMGNWMHTGPDALLLDTSQRPDTLLVEAASIAARQAAGALRTTWGFQGWAHYDEAAWHACQEEATSAFVRQPRVRIATLHGNRAELARALRTAGIDADVQVVTAEQLTSLGRPALLTCDLIEATDEPAVQAQLVSTFVGATRATKPDCTVAFSRDNLPSLALGAQPETTIQTKLGRDDACLCQFDTLPDTPPSTIEIPGKDSSSTIVITPLVTTSNQFAARLRKNARLRARWAKKEDVTCYRVYDADLPDYAVTIDLYQGCDSRTMMPTGRRWLQISEYAAPKEVDPALARCRLLDVLTIAPAVLGVKERDVFVRVRRHGKGGSQYANEGSRAQGFPFHSKGNSRSASRRHNGPILPPGAHLIEEGGLLFEVNFSDRLDCGIFLDHRETRSMLREMAKQTKGSKRFLNLFAYTGTATCYAADGGMYHTTTVDLSRPSLDWARRNMERNGFQGKEHEYVQTDVLKWIGEQRHTPNRWDLIFCDVPTFSNSSRMRGRSFDVQRDHSELLINLSRLLTRDGICVFSCNLRSFAPDLDKLQRAKVEIEDITAQTIPEDFARNKKVHHAYLVRRIRTS